MFWVQNAPKVQIPSSQKDTSEAENPSSQKDTSEAENPSSQKDTHESEDLSTQNVVQFIDQHISCYRPTEEEDSTLQQLVTRQTHKHSHTCKKGNNNNCRFNYPMPPMRNTTILTPLDYENMPVESDVEKTKALWTKIQKHLTEMKYGEHISFDQFLDQINISEQDYIQAIRSSIKTTTVFLKRSPYEIRVNPYNKHLLLATRANMDIQFIMDVYACAKYIASYVTKGQRGMSELLRKACAEVRAGNGDIRQQLKHISNKFLNAVEISAQEAAYILLQLPMKKSSRQVLFVNTNMPEDRVMLLKPQAVIETMKDDEEDIMATGLIQRYKERPASLEEVSLAEYAAWYNNKRKINVTIKQSTWKKTTDGYLPETTDLDNEEDLLPEEIYEKLTDIESSSTVSSEQKRRKV
jgi:hypothetical protein